MINFDYLISKFILKWSYKKGLDLRENI
nr:hypothetical protein BAR15_180258 [Bartonella sp. AR 15-3]